jgi:hypothetical protein
MITLKQLSSNITRFHKVNRTTTVYNRFVSSSSEHNYEISPSQINEEKPVNDNNDKILYKDDSQKMIIRVMLSVAMVNSCVRMLWLFS